MKSSFLIIYILLSSFIYAQLETAHWFFGNHAGLNFTSGSPVADTNGALDTWEGCSSISDKNGNLLFYTDGSTVYNKNHSIMSNGTGLLGNSSSTQSGIIIPDPYTPTLYYIFSVHTNDISPTNSQGIHYSLVDMSLDYGNGAVISGKKNIPLPLNGVQKSFENITAVKHANGKDIWIITQFIDKFYAFKIDNSGLNTIPVISKVGISVPLDHDCRLGYIKISPDSKKLAIAHYSKALAIYDFNSFTGEVSNEVILDTNKHFYGIEFSPNNKILYSSEADETTIHQYDLTAISIPNSKFLLYKGNNQSYFGALQLGLDKKIYHTAINDKALSVIENPDIYKSGANFKPLTINLGGKISTYGLPSIMVSFFNGTILINGDLNLSEFCLNEPLTFSLNTNLSTYTANWDFGDGNTVINNNTPIHTYTTFGTYLVKVILKYKDLNENEQNITFDKTITIHPKPSVNLGPDKILCEGTSVTLDAGNPGASYLWSTGETTQTINVIKSGSYSVTVTDKNGCSNSDEVMVTVNPKPSVNLGPDKILCEGTSVTLDAGNPGASYLWSTGETTQTINVIKSGSYSVTVTDKNGCSNSDEVMVTVNPNPSVYLGLDQILCEGTSVTLDAGNPGASYLWSTGETTQTINVIKSGSYSVTVTDKNGCSNSDEVMVTVNPKPSVNLGLDKILCEGSSLTLDAGNPGASYQWSTGETTQTINVIKSGSYSVTVTDKNGCSNSDEVMVTVNPKPSVNLGPDKILCEGASLTLDAGNPGTSYLWSTGETTQTINVIKPGSYSVTVTDNNNCSVSSSVIINFLNPFIKEVKVNKNTAEIVAIGNSLLQYSLDMIHWQYSPVFYNLEFKIYNAYVKNASGCISAPFPFGLLNVPNIITPNKDGINDVWNLKGLELYPGSSVKIFDRYGKLLVNTKIDKGFVWDGKYLGKNVATASYWYIIELTDGRKLTGWIMVRNYNEKDQ